MMTGYHTKASIEFSDLRLKIKRREVLRGVSGRAEPGQLLAVMGPSGAGKTLLLNCLAGRQRALDSGHILINGQPLTKRLRRQISFVLQEDLFLSELTLRETFKFTADLRLPSRMTNEEKERKIQDIVDTLDLNKCLDTRIGDSLDRGLSGGEKKRANIGCELLTDPSILLLDEPTSGLDSRTACELLETLKEYAIVSGKTVITSIHQPSSRMFHMFDRLLLLSEGEVVYFGEAGQVVDYFARLGLHCPQHYNPADYIIDVVKGSDEERTKIHSAAKTRPWNHLYHGKHSPNCITVPVEIATENEASRCQERLDRALSTGTLQDGSFDNSVFIDCDIDDDYVRRQSEGNATTNLSSSNTNGNASHYACVRSSYSARPLSDACEHGEFNPTSQLEKLKVNPPSTGSERYHVESYDKRTFMDSKWPTGFWHQLVTLTQRNFKQNRYLVLSKLDIFKQLTIGLLAGALWFQISFTAENVRDISGMIFFLSAYWGFESVYSSLTAFQTERAVVAKERSAGAYRLSAYFMSKVIGVAPLLSTLTAVAGTIAFWMVGLHDSIWIYFCFIITLILYVQTGQAIGCFISAACSSVQQAITASSLTMLASMLLGGFYVENVPGFLWWMRYTSFTSYVYGALLSAVFLIDPQIVSCNTTLAISEFGDCLPTVATEFYTNMSLGNNVMGSNSTEIVDSRGTLDGAEIVKTLTNFDLPIWAYYLILTGFLFLFNFLAYLALRTCRTHS